MINFSRASENNKAPILAQLHVLFDEPGEVLEIGSGSGQHAIHFASALAHLTWQPTDQGVYFDGLLKNLERERAKNILTPIYLDIASEWPTSKYRYGFSANVLHIASSRMIAPFFAGFARCLEAGGVLCVYGPFKYGGDFTSQSNARFDVWLKNRNAESGVRDIEMVQDLAARHGFSQLQDIPMPANNQLIVFRLTG